MIRPPPRSPLFPSTPLFRSPAGDEQKPDSGFARLHGDLVARVEQDRKSTRLNSSHSQISYAVFCLKKKKDTIGYLIHPQNCVQPASLVEFFHDGIPPHQPHH